MIKVDPNLKSKMDFLLGTYCDTFTKNAEAVEEAAFRISGIKAGDLVLKRKK